MRKMTIVLLVLAVAVGCTWRKSKKEEEESPNVGKAVVVTLLTGDLIEGKVTKETEKEISILGKKGEVTFLKTQIAKVEEPTPKKEPEFKPKPLPPPDTTSDEGPMPYAAIRGKRVFHKATCTLLRGQPASKVDLYKTRQEAVSEGLRPCGTCNP